MNITLKNPSPIDPNILSEKKPMIAEKMKMSIFMALYGHVLERYEVTLYGFLSTLLVPLFFPQDNATVSFLLGMGAFAAGYLTRPLGGFFFGYIGDLYGRKRALLSSILLVSIPTFIMGILPTYAQIGITAPIILVICRLLQGLCVGGEYSGAAVYFFESCRAEKTGFFGSIMSGTAFCGAILGSLIGTLCTMSFMPEWGWRIPFLLGAILGVIGFFIRRNIRETPIFIQEESGYTKENKFENPFFNLLKNEKRNVLCTLIIGSTGYVCLYISTIYLNSVIAQTVNPSSFIIMAINTLVLCSWVVFILMFGYLSDFFGKKFILQLSSWGIVILSFPFFYLITQASTLVNIVIFQVLLGFLGASFFGVAAGFVPNLFHVKQRFTGVAAGLNIGQALLGGTTPFIATLLVYVTGDQKAPAFFLMVAGIMAVAATRFAIPKQQPANRNSSYLPNNTKPLDLTGMA
jgi:MHS family proline/betaine transporter-like MFS transporter